MMPGWAESCQKKMRGKRFLILTLLLALTAYLFDMECLLGGPECCLDETVCIAPVHLDHAPVILVTPPSVPAPLNETVETLETPSFPTACDPQAPECRPARAPPFA